MTSDNIVLRTLGRNVTSCLIARYKKIFVLTSRLNAVRRRGQGFLRVRPMPEIFVLQVSSRSMIVLKDSTVIFSQTLLSQAFS